MPLYNPDCMIDCIFLYLWAPDSLCLSATLYVSHRPCPTLYVCLSFYDLIFLV